MDKPELLAQFKDQLEAYEKFQGFIDKARSMTDKFRPEVVEKVVVDNTEKMAGVSEILDPLVGEMRGNIDELEAQRKGVEESIETARLALEELELRKEIGELDDDSFDVEASGHREEVANGDEVLGSVDGELSEFRGLLERWEAMRPAAAETIEEDLLGDLDEDEDDEAFADDGSRGDGVHAELVEGVADDVSAVFDDDGGAAETIDESSDEGEESDELSLGDDDDDDADAGEGISFGDDELEDLGSEIGESDEAAGGDGGDAALVLGEGTDDEHVYPFNGEVISLGRGRDNTIQVKNDSKVSRYHCKLFERDGSFFIEDNKSANGTLVDGELITEKRLLGGEEIIIGETFFKFRIHG